MPLEVEAKVAVKRFGPVRERLDGLGGVFLGRVLEHNMMFDRPGGDLEGRGCRLRLRVSTPAPRSGSDLTEPVLTFKGPRLAGPLKSREEIELPVGDTDEMKRLLEAMGYVLTFQYEKRRDSWLLGPCRVELDKVPMLGRFVEIEATKDRHVHRALGQLGLAVEPLVKRGYAALLRRRLAQTQRGTSGELVRLTGTRAA